MARKNNNKKNNKSQQQTTPAASTTSASKAPATGTLSEEDQKLLDFAKQAMVNGQPDLDEFIKLLEDDYTNVYEAKKGKIDEDLATYCDSRKADFEKKLNDDNADLIKSNEELQNQIAKVEKEVSGLEDKINNAESQKEKILEDAKKEAEKIVEDAKKEAEKQNEEALKDIENQKKDLDDREEKIEDKEIELECKESALAIKERRLDKKAEVYETANPDAIESLERALAMRMEQLESVRTEYEKAQRELNKLRINMIHAEGVSVEDLQKSNDILRKKVEELENKCNRYTEEELNEMQAAFEAKDGWLTQIRNLTNEVSANRLELTRVNNSIQEYEQLKSQLDLLRTLNDHLRAELDNTKRMLESNVGEICPALTSIDIEESADSGDSYVHLEERLNNQNEDRIKTLRDVVEQVKNYAASQAKPLFYSDKDLRAFIAGMAASPLAILQGMSGTGKTSLPKIFCEALLGEICVVPVESSWRDRNELLGYYNDFSKKFTAKEFTCNLYRAGCKRYENTIYFIVLDEMNLSRVEYYFADFLSVLEDKKEKWLIKLVDTDMRQLPTEITDEVLKALKKDKSEEGKELLEIVEKLYPENNTMSDDAESSVSGSDKLKLITYIANKQFKNKTSSRGLIGGPQNLINGNTIRIPKNVWFIGTANRDESTFEITDKVYDRAQVLNFNNRAKGARKSADIPKIFLTYDELNTLFKKAKSSKTYSFSAEDCALLKEIESILKSYFRISYGNRIQDQMDAFVPVYVAAGSTPIMKTEDIQKLENEAIDYQLTNKVLRKLEYEEINKEAAEKLRKIFEKHGLEQAREFINWKTRGEEI